MQRWMDIDIIVFRKVILGQVMVKYGVVRKLSMGWKKHRTFDKEWFQLFGSIGFAQCEYDTSLFRGVVNMVPVFVVTYVDDLLFFIHTERVLDMVQVN